MIQKRGKDYLEDQQDKHQKLLLKSGHSSRFGRELLSHKKSIRFGQFTENFWVWDKCSYVKTRREREADLSKNYVDQMRALLIHYILPYFAKIKLEKITARMIERWLFSLKEAMGHKGKKLSNMTKNHCLTCLKLILKEAVRLDYLSKNPANGIMQFKEKPRERGILTFDEVKVLFMGDVLQSIWNGSLKFYTINLTAATSGARMGELQGLKRNCVYNDYISIVQSWESKNQILKEPKWGSIRIHECNHFCASFSDTSSNHWA